MSNVREERILTLNEVKEKLKPEKGYPLLYFGAEIPASLLWQYNMKAFLAFLSAIDEKAMDYHYYMRNLWITMTLDEYVEKLGKPFNNGTKNAKRAALALIPSLRFLQVDNKYVFLQISTPDERQDMISFSINGTIDWAHLICEVDFDTFL